jgi:hypothetical protein
MIFRVNVLLSFLHRIDDEHYVINQYGMNTCNLSERQIPFYSDSKM